MRFFWRFPIPYLIGVYISQWARLSNGGGIFEGKKEGTKIADKTKSLHKNQVFVCDSPTLYVFILEWV